MSTVFSGLGGTLQVKISGSYATVAGIYSITGPGMTQGSRETTTLDPASGWRSFAPTISDGGEVSATLFLDISGTAQATIVGMFGVLGVGTGGATYDWKVVTSSGNAFAFTGFITAFNVDEQSIDGNLEADITVKVIGQVVWS